MFGNNSGCILHKTCYYRPHMESILPIIQIILSVLIVITILLQRTSSGFDGALGGGSGENSITTTRRGFEKVLFRATIVIAVLLVASSIVTLLV